MTARASLRWPTAAALALGGLAAALLGPGRAAYFGDQGHYENLARILAGTGQLARALTAAGPTPEPLRTFGYPGFLALIEKVAGPGHLPVVIVQVLLAALLPALVFLLARPYLTERLSLVAAWAAALYVPFAYYAVFALSDLLATVLVTGASAAYARAVTTGGGRALVLAGALFGAAGLVRPSLLVLGVVLVLPFLARRGLRRLAVTTAAVAAFVLIGAAPSYAYTVASFDRFAVNAAGGGIGIWYGYWHGVWPGKTTEAILAAGGGGRRAGGDLRARIPRARAGARAGGLVQGGARPLSRHRCRIPRAGACAHPRRPARVGGAGSLPSLTDPLVVLWGLQAVLAALAAVGAVVLARRSPGTALWFGAGLLALWAAHFAFSAEARYTLPVKGWLIVLAVAGGAYLLDHVRGRARRSAAAS